MKRIRYQDLPPEQRRAFDEARAVVALRDGTRRVGTWDEFIAAVEANRVLVVRHLDVNDAGERRYEWWEPASPSPSSDAMRWVPDDADD